MHLRVLLLAIFLVTPAASAQPLLAQVIDEKIGEVDAELANAERTYGQRDEFLQAHPDLNRSLTALRLNATLVSQDSLVKAAGGLATGKARAQAQGAANESRDTIEQGKAIADEANAILSQVRSSLDSMESTGMSPFTFAGALAVGHEAVLALEHLNDHQQAVEQYNQGPASEQAEAGVVSTAAAARLVAQNSRELLQRLTEARANAPISPILTHEDLEALASDRVQWVQQRGGSFGQASRTLALNLHGENELVMSLAASSVFLQDQVLNGVLLQAERSSDVDPIRIAEDLMNKTTPGVEQWLERFDTTGNVPFGAIRSAQLTVDLNRDATDRNRDLAGAAATAYLHLAIEHVAMLYQGYADVEHEPGNELAAFQAREPGDGTADGLSPWMWALIGLGVVAVAALGYRRIQE